MSKYHKHCVKLSQAQMRTLAKGGKISIRHSHLHGPHELHLTSTQLARLNRHHANKTGMHLQMSNAQLSHHKRIGGNILSDLLGKLKSGAATLGNHAIKGLKYGAQQAIKHGGPLASEFIHSKLKEHVGENSANIVNGLFKDLLTKAEKKLGRGMAVHMHKHLHKMVRGKPASWDDLISGINDAVGVIGKVVESPIGQLGMKAIMGMGVKGKRKGAKKCTKTCSKKCEAVGGSFKL